ncbi:Unconventional myosin-XIX [Saguinus oedipus]|uniref:Unconventional myosin-XIX n=1 Tax=Saguinus oedipus TaxID=9490 RepID=A0ABQ9VPQ5_SAGOE|nr:Unconventional myosin-XIX [Saguinus oedipus]
MKFYAVVAASPASWESHKIAERIEQRILNSNPVMEAFGNACTLRNNNSSRFGKFIQLQLNRAQQLVGATVQTYLLEKTRVVCQAFSERNFHIFYQVSPEQAAFASGWRHLGYVYGVFHPCTCPGLSAGTSEPCDVATVSHSSYPNPTPIQAWAFLKSPSQPPTHPSPQICKGASEDERLQWHLPEGAAFSWLPNPERSLEEDCFEVTREAMLHLGIDTPTQNNIFKELSFCCCDCTRQENGPSQSWPTSRPLLLPTILFFTPPQVLAGLLHLGNIQFAASEDEAQPCQPMDDAKCEGQGCGIGQALSGT